MLPAFYEPIDICQSNLVVMVKAIAHDADNQVDSTRTAKPKGLVRDEGNVREPVGKRLHKLPRFSVVSDQNGHLGRQNAASLQCLDFSVEKGQHIFLLFPAVSRARYTSSSNLLLFFATGRNHT